MAQENIAQWVLNRYSKIRIKEQKERAAWTKCYQFVNNWVDGELGQWESTWRDRMGMRPMLSLNETRKFVNRICGAWTQVKIDEQVLPRDDVSDPAVAEILSDLIKYVYDLNKVESLSFRRAVRDMVICGRGYVKTEFSDEKDVLGEISLKAVNPFKIYLIGQGESYDISEDRKGIIEVLPMTREDAEQIYGKDLGDVASDADAGRSTQLAGTDYRPSGTVEDYYDKETGEFKILRTQKYEWKSVTFAKLPSGELEEVSDPKNIQGISVETITKKIKKIRVIASCSDKVLKDEWSQYEHNKFDTVGFFAYNDAGRITGIVQDLLDPQIEKNKRRSAVIHILNASPRNNYFVKKNSFDDIEDARKRVGGINQLIEVNGNPNDAMVPIESNLTAVPAIIGMEQAATQDMKEISGLTDASLGIVPEGVKSGRGIESLKAPTEMIIAELFDNGLISRELVAERVLSLIQQFYDEPRRIRILGDYSSDFLPPELASMREQLKQQVLMAKPELGDEGAGVLVNKMLEVQNGFKIVAVNIDLGNKKLNDLSAGKFDVVIDHVPHSPTARRAQFYDMQNLKAMGAPISWESIISASDIRGKQKILAQIPIEEQKMQMEAMLAASQSGARTATPPKQPVPGDLMRNSAGNQLG